MEKITEDNFTEYHNEFDNIPEANQSTANQLTGIYITTTLVFNVLRKPKCIVEIAATVPEGGNAELQNIGAKYGTYKSTQQVDK